MYTPGFVARYLLTVGLCFNNMQLHKIDPCNSLICNRVFVESAATDSLHTNTSGSTMIMWTTKGSSLVATISAMRSI